MPVDISLAFGRSPHSGACRTKTVDSGDVGDIKTIAVNARLHIAAQPSARLMHHFRSRLVKAPQILGDVGRAKIRRSEHEFVRIGDAGQHRKGIIPATIARLDIGVETVTDGEALFLGHRSPPSWAARSVLRHTWRIPACLRTKPVPTPVALITAMIIEPHPGAMPSSRGMVRSRLVTKYVAPCSTA